MHTFVRILVTSQELSAWSNHRANERGRTSAESEYMELRPDYFWMIPSKRGVDIKIFRRFLVADESSVIRVPGESCIVGAPVDTVQRFWFNTKFDELSGAKRRIGGFGVSYVGYAERSPAMASLLRYTQGAVYTLRTSSYVNDILAEQGREVRPI